MLRFNNSSGDLTWNNENKARLNRSESLILSYLLRNINNFSSKDDLLSAGWPGKFISPNSLAVAIKNIRQALSNTTPSFSIETVHRRGYILHGDPLGFKLLENGVPENEILSQEKPVQSQQDCDKNIINKEEIIKTRGINTRIIKNYVRTFFPQFKGIAFLVYILISLYFSFVFFIYTGDLYCYQLNATTTACGVFHLNKKHQETLKKILKDKEGDFYYGHENHSHEFKLYKKN